MAWVCLVISIADLADFCFDLYYCRSVEYDGLSKTRVMNMSIQQEIMAMF